MSETWMGNGIEKFRYNMNLHTKKITIKLS